MKNSGRKIISSLLTISMSLSIVSFLASGDVFAADFHVDQDIINANEGALPSEERMVLDEDIVVTEGLTTETGNYLDLDLNENTIYYNNSDKTEYLITSDDYVSVKNGQIISDGAPILHLSGDLGGIAENVKLEGSVDGFACKEGRFGSGAIFLEMTGSSFTLRYSEISKFSAQKGGAIYASTYGSRVNICCSEIHDCCANEGGAVYAESFVSVYESSQIVSNSSLKNGGAFCIVNEATLSLARSSIYGNVSFDGVGGGVYINKIPSQEPHFNNDSGLSIDSKARVEITNNFGISHEDNVYLAGDCPLTRIRVWDNIKPLGANVNVGIRVAPEHADLPIFENMSPDEDLSNFTSDDDSLFFCVDNGNIVLAPKQDLVLIEGYKLLVYDGYIGIRFYFYIDTENVNVSNTRLQVESIGFDADRNAALGLGGFSTLINVGSDVNFNNLGFVSDGNLENYYYWDVAIDSAYMTREFDYKVKEGSNVLLEGTVSVKDYADAVLGSTKYSQYWGIVKAMLNYGAASQKYFNVDTDNLANKDLSVFDKTTTITESEMNALDQYSTDPVATNDVISYYGASLVLKGIIRSNLYFTFGDTDGLDGLDIFKDNSETPYLSVNMKNKSLSYLKFEMNYASLQDLMKSHNYKVYGYFNGSGEGVLLLDFDYSAGNYFYTFYNEYDCTDDNLTELMNSLYKLYLMSQG